MTSIRAVAERAGVSSATVSRALNGSGYVSEAVRRTVEQASADLGYRPNVHAQRLRGKRSNTIGLIFNDAMNPFFGELAFAVEDIARQRGFSVIVGNTRWEFAAHLRYLETFGSYGVDGMIIVPTQMTKRQHAALNALTVPYVLLDQRIASMPVDQVATDSVEGARRMVNHLVQIGHRRIALIGGDRKMPTARERLQGYRESLAANTIVFDEALVRTRDFSTESGYLLTQALLRETMPDALFAVNLNTLVGTVRAVREAGLSIPNDIAVTGFDDVPFMAAIDPFLTVVTQQNRALGVVAAQLLLDKIEGKRATTDHQTILLQAELIVRKSCGAAIDRHASEGKRSARTAPVVPDGRGDDTERE